MSVAYGWAFSNPVRKVFYNLTITGLSVFVALMIGTVEIAQITSSTSSSSAGCGAMATIGAPSGVLPPRRGRADAGR